MAEMVGQALVLTVMVIVVLISQRRGAIVIILLGVAVRLASFSLGPEWSLLAANVLIRGGNIVTYSALSWVVAQAVYARGRVTAYRLQGAAVLYLNLAAIFAAAFRLIWNVNPAAFNLPAPRGDAGDIAQCSISASPR